MGIPLLWSHLGGGRRVALTKLVEENFLAKGHYRIAIDASIWAFQTRAAQGGTNPALRTVYYRLAKLMLTGISPLFIFDGPERPSFKRNKKVNHYYGHARQTKSLISLFGFDWLQAAGEAEAECARLQRLGVVDAIMTEDVDSLMFQGDNVLRDWSGENGRNIPSHVTLFDRQTILQRTGLTSPAMILIALMAGGDYIPAGIEKVGIKTAIEAGSAGYGEQMLAASSLDEWTKEFAEALRTNEGGVFARRHPAVSVSPAFPDREVLQFYVNPKVNDRVPECLWQNTPRPLELRKFLAEHVGWVGKKGALNFLRSFAPAYLAYKLRHSQLSEDQYAVHASRNHDLAGMCKEYRISFVPLDIIPYDFEAEPEESDMTVETVANGVEEEDDEQVEISVTTPRKPRNANFDPYMEQRAWILGCIAEMDFLEKVQKWEAAKQAKSKAEAKTHPRTKVLGSDQRGDIHKYFKSVKTTPAQSKAGNSKAERSSPRKAPKAAAPSSPTKRPKTPPVSVLINSSPPPSTSPSSAMTRLGLLTPRTRRSVVLRDSLEGAWKDASGDAKEKAWKDIDVLDLSTLG